MSTPAERVLYEDVRDYLKHHGWVAKPSRREWAAIYRLGQEAEVIVPLERDLVDYGEAIERVARRTAEVEGRSTEAVLNDFLQPKADVIRFALEGTAMITGSVDLSAGVDLLQGAKRCLLASAMSAKRAVRFHPRMSSTEADAYVAACRMGQAELGSFVISLQAPLYVQSSADVSEEPFGRRATEQLFRASSTLVRAIRQDTVQQTLLDVPDERSPVSANLCEALVEAMPSNESADLRLRATWSPMVPAHPSVDADLRIDRDMFETIEQLGQKLRPAQQSSRHRFVGYVLGLSGGWSVEGGVTMRVLVDEEYLDVKVNLSPEQYQQAGQAHLQRKLVVGEGVLYRRQRKHEIRDVQSLTTLDK